jgi:hypothetical protein
MRFYILTFVIILMHFSSEAQYRLNEDEIKHHQINLNGSASTWGFLIKRDGNLNIKSDSLGYTGKALPAIQLAYDYYFNENVSLGLIGSSQSMSMKINYLTFKNSENIPVRFKNIAININRKYVGLRFNYHFINDKEQDLYAGLRFGAVFWSIKPSITNTDLDKKLNASFPGTIFPAMAIGYKYKIKERLGIGIELSLGIPQLFAYGIDYRF